MSKECGYHILGGISSAAAGPVAAGMMLKQRETMLAATGVTSRYEGPALSRGWAQRNAPACSLGTWLGEGRRGGSLSSWGCRQKEVPFLERGLSNVSARSPALSWRLSSSLAVQLVSGFDDCEMGSLVSGWFYW